MHSHKLQLPKSGSTCSLQLLSLEAQKKIVYGSNVEEPGNALLAAVVSPSLDSSAGGVTTWSGESAKSREVMCPKAASSAVAFSTSLTGGAGTSMNEATQTPKKPLLGDGAQRA